MSTLKAKEHKWATGWCLSATELRQQANLYARITGTSVLKGEKKIKRNLRAEDSSDDSWYADEAAVEWTTTTKMSL